MERAKRYYVKEVASITGLSAQVIRKWEDRYGIVRPERLDNGYRVYSEADIAKLMRAKSLQLEGHSLLKVAKLLEGSAETDSGEQSVIPSEKKVGHTAKLLEAGSRCDEGELSLILRHAYNELGLRSFLDDVVIPFLEEVGRKWETEEWGEFQESFSSLVIRDFLINLRRNYKAHEEAPLVIGACFPGETHEIPVHIILLKLMLEGYQTHLIGASPAPGVIEAITDRLDPAIVLLSAATTLPFIRHPEVLPALDRFAASRPEIRFYAGGEGTMLYTASHQPVMIRVTNDVEEIGPPSGN
ncbi:MerR family transcriptional regulator [Bhargavaea ullalensis]|uniref:DNA-binding transcriptional MerR regulator n=1 Tax=Bhargavaea ullalensis TaxID=1265685 RepID=A0ABV2G7Y1_9BACL